MNLRIPFDFFFFLLGSSQILNVRFIDLYAVKRQFSTDGLGSLEMLIFCF